MKFFKLYAAVLGMFLIISLLGLLQTGCATVAPGADTLVVRVEQAETTGLATFDLVLNIENSNRALWRSKFPQFHTFCEWLRQPQSADSGLRPGMIGTYPRSLAMLMDLDRIKRDYKSAKATESDLQTALDTVNSALTQASTWLTIVQAAPAAGVTNVSTPPLTQPK